MNINNNKILQIGKQIWTAANCNGVVFNNGEAIIQSKTSTEWRNSIINKIPAFCYSIEFPGEVLYNWYAVNDSRKILPEEFKIPSSEDVKVLEGFLGKDLAGLKLKSMDDNFFPECAYLNEEERERKNTMGNNSNFNGKAVGYRSKNGFVRSGLQAFFWVIDDSKPSCFRITDDWEGLDLYSKPNLIEGGFSIRGILKF